MQKYESGDHSATLRQVQFPPPLKHSIPRKLSRKTTKTKAATLSIQRGIKVLEDFGFREEMHGFPGHKLTIHINVNPPKTLKSSLFVSDFWSHRQKKEFLMRTGLRKAQIEREKRLRKAVLVASKTRVESPYIADQLYSRLLAEDNPTEAGKLYACGSDGLLLKQIGNQVNANTQKSLASKPTKMGFPKYWIYRSPTRLEPLPKKTGKTVGRLQELITRCDDTMKGTTASRE